MKNHLTIASVQMFATTKQETNLKTMEEYLIHINAIFPQIDLVVFPELSSMSIGSKMAKQTQPIPGELTGIFASWAKKYGDSPPCILKKGAPASLSTGRVNKKTRFLHPAS